jgi:ABC-type multidrug transport system permease subunit
MNQGESQQFIDPRLVDREEAMALIEDNAISAVVVIPEGFTRAYLDAESPPPLELIKNPAQSFYPAIIEEMMDAAVELLNALSRTFGTELRDMLALLEVEEGERVSMLAMASLLIRLEGVFVSVEDYLFPPLMVYEKEERLETDGEAGPGFSMFSFVLSGMAAMFMLFIAMIAIGDDLYQEIKNHTLARFRTLSPGVMPFVTGKVLFTLVLLLICAGVLLFGGGLIFRIDWQNPLPIALLCLAYGLYCTGLMACAAALAGKEQKLAVIGHILIFGQAFVGGTMIPVQQLPSVLRDHVSPYIPLHWFTGSIRTIENGVGDLSWIMAVAKLGVIGLILIVVSVLLLDRFVSKGRKA